MEDLTEAIEYMEVHLIPKYISESEDSSGPQLNADIHRHVIAVYELLQSALDELSE